MEFKVELEVKRFELAEFWNVALEEGLVDRRVVFRRSKMGIPLRKREETSRETMQNIAAPEVSKAEVSTVTEKR